MNPPKATLSVIEPNLRTPSGHYAEFVHALQQPASDREAQLSICAHPDSDALFEAITGVEAETGSPRTNEPFGEWKIISDKVQSGQSTLILTANAKHVAWVNLCARRNATLPTNICFYFHWIERSKSKKLLHRISKRTRENAIAIAPTAGIAKSLEALGWKNVFEIPYPAARPAQSPQPQAFEKLLMAGAARINKGLPLVAALAENWQAKGLDIPLWVQVSTKHFGKHGQKEKAVVDRLIASGYQGLACEENPPPRQEYFKRFKGALVLAPYDLAKFKDGVSGVVLDALLSGTPVIATKGTWAGNQIDRFHAGATFPPNDIDAFEKAIFHVLDNWEAMQENAIAAAKTLADEHYPDQLLKVALGSQS